MAKIKRLDKNLISQIAAGEVIERPASVVKELVENSIDAGASKISVNISSDSRDIRVADNGSGIGKDDLELTFTRHATSKISSQEDLWNINSLGFRGEALASMISIAKVTCITKTAEDENGSKAQCKESEVKISSVGCSVGTTMEVNELFYNTPVRLKFLKNPKTELAHIQEIMQTIAISHPEISFELTSSNAVLLKTTGSSNIEVAISEVYSPSLVKDLMTVENTDNSANMSLQGIISTPVFSRSNRKAMYFFVNGRSVKCPVVLKAVDNVYKDLIPVGKFPFVAVSLNLKPDEVDVNVHPSKKEVRYTNTNMVYNFVYFSIKNALNNFAPNNQDLEVSFERKAQLEEPSDKFSEIQHHPSGKTDFSSFRAASVSSFASEPSFRPVSQEKFLQTKFLEPSIKTVDVETPDIIGQFRNTYILIENEAGLEIIDQHIAHERYIYENLKESLKNNGSVPSQLFFTSNKIVLEPSEIALIEENAQVLEKFGYKFEIDENTVSIKQLPAVTAQNNPDNVVGAVVECLHTNFDKLEDKMLIMTSCKAAIKAGQKLSLWEMQDLIKKYRTTQNPQTCPHGRVISHIIPEKDLAKFFGRQVT
ncbi:MAG: DNA mismatch repair endonuclease MutL [Candidatus Gastranaerophilales bacterium]|nr:DNA mismatch repair endonuclease MutL [Candidatus Gastranaerophilales bacterium]